MSKRDLAQVKECFAIRHFADFVVVLGKYLYVFSVSGDMQYCQRNICYPYEVARIGADLLLVRAVKNYYLLTIKDGSIVWSVRKSNQPTFHKHFAVTSSGNFAYDGYSAIGGFYLVELDLLAATKREYKIPARAHAISDIFCDANGNPCVLQHQLIEPERSDRSTNSIICLHNGDIAWENTWTFSDGISAFSFFGDTDTVLTHDLKLYHVPNKIMTDLLSNETQWKAPKKWISAVNMDASGRYMTIKYQHSNAVVDLSEHRVVAQYAAQSKGIVIGNSFWIGSNEGVCIEPFPIMEEIPGDKYVSWSPFR